MSSQRRTQPQVEPMDRRVLLSSVGAARPRNVDVSGEVMRMNLTTPPKSIGRTARVYSIQGTGGVAEMGRVRVSGSATDTGRDGAHAFKGSLTLANSSGTVTIKFASSA